MISETSEASFLMPPSAHISCAWSVPPFVGTSIFTPPADNMIFFSKCRRGMQHFPHKAGVLLQLNDRSVCWTGFFIPYYFFKASAKLSITE